MRFQYMCRPTWEVWDPKVARVEASGLRPVMPPQSKRYGATRGKLELDAWPERIREVLHDSGAWDAVVLNLDEEHLYPYVLRPVVSHLRAKLDEQGIPHPPVYLRLSEPEEWAFDEVEYLWHRLWHGADGRASALVVERGSEEHRRVTVSCKGQKWAREVLPVVVEHAIVTADLLRRLLGDEGPSHQWSYRMRALREWGLVRPLITRHDDGLREWHAEVTGEPLGRRPVRFHRSVLHDFVYPRHGGGIAR